MVSSLALRLEAFTKLSTGDREVLERLILGSVRDVSARRDLVREGDRPRYVYVMVEGWACRYKTLPDGRRQIVAFFIPGDLCDSNVCILREMDHSVAAITPIRVAEISAEELEQVTARHPRIMQALWWNELVSVSIQREWTLNIGQRTAWERLAHVLVELFLRLQCVGLTRDSSCDFPLTQLDLADATGLTAVHVNRTLQELRRRGLIDLHGKLLTIRDLQALKDAALFNENYLHLSGDGRHLDAND